MKQSGPFLTSFSTPLPPKRGRWGGGGQEQDKKGFWLVHIKLLGWTRPGGVECLRLEKSSGINDRVLLCPPPTGLSLTKGPGGSAAAPSRTPPAACVAPSRPLPPVTARGLSFKYPPQHPRGVQTMEHSNKVPLLGHKSTAFTSEQLQLIEKINIFSSSSVSRFSPVTSHIMSLIFRCGG